MRYNTQNACVFFFEMLDRTRAVICRMRVHQWTAGEVKTTTNAMRRERGTVKSETTNERKSTTATTTKKEERNEAKEEKKHSYVHHLGGYSKHV